MDYKIKEASIKDNKLIIDFLRNYANEFWFWNVEERKDIMECPMFYKEKTEVSG